MQSEERREERQVSKRKNNSTKKSKKKEEKRLSVQKTIRYKEMGKDGICRVQGNTYSKCIRFYDINCQLAQLFLKTGVISSTILTAASISS